MKRWTVLLYIAADDNKDATGDTRLATAAFDDIKELRLQHSSRQIDIGVQMDLNPFRPIRFAVGKDGALVLPKQLRETSTGNPNTLVSFLSWAQTNLPADRYLLVLWGHGMGVGFELRVRLTLGDVAFDTGDGLNPREIAKALSLFKKERGRALDVLGFDSCFMSSVELNYELRNLVDIVVSTQESIPIQGWPYGRILTQLRANPLQSTTAVGRMITEEVVKSFPANENVTQTAVDPSSGEAVAGAFSVLVKELREEIRDRRRLSAILRALRRARFVRAREFVDLADVCHRVVKASHSPAVRRAAKEVRAMLKGRSSPFIVSHRTRGTNVRGLNGVSIYFRRVPRVPGSLRPTKGNVKLDLGEYRKLGFVEATGWQEFVDKLPAKV